MMIIYFFASGFARMPIPPITCGSNAEPYHKAAKSMPDSWSRGIVKFSIILLGNFELTLKTIGNDGQFAGFVDACRFISELSAVSTTINSGSCNFASKGFA
jgi:hypothetical protein